MPWTETIQKTKPDGRVVPKRCKVERLDETIRRFIENSYEEGISPVKISDMLKGEPYNLVVGKGTIKRHCEEHFFLRHLEEADAVKRGVDPQQQSRFKEFLMRKSIFFDGHYTVPFDLLEETFDPLRRLQELFFAQYTRFVKLLQREMRDETTLVEVRYLGSELRSILVEIGKMQGTVADEPVIQEASFAMLLVKAFDQVPMANRTELIAYLENNETESLEDNV